jgi:EAL domain-containing protein (putative c-di-GMP-specific phosphodiesterase class I)/ActR/RegA family two-component response regulator
MHEPRPDTTTSAPPEGFRGRVLIVEDDRGLLEAYTDVLLEAGFDVAAASNGTGALRALDGDAFDVVLTDVVMPGCTGLDILRAVRERDLDVPVVLVTGNPSVESAVQAVEMGALHYLVKPVGRAELIRSVEHACRLRKLAAVKRDALRYLGHIDRPAGDRAGLEAVFARALGGLFMAYQPIVRTLDGSVFGWEALLRTKEPAVTNPLAFLETAERLGRVGELGRQIRASVARTASQSRGTVFFVNLHADDLLDDALFDPSSPLSALAPEIVLEITERSPFDDIPDVRDRIRKLRSLGFRLALDDLGSGYAGLTSFAALEPEFVKLDRGLVQRLVSAAVKRKPVAAIVTVSRDLGITVVAEGIETAAERAAVADLGCDLMQGFFFRRPEEWREENGCPPAAAGSPCPPTSAS